MCVCFLGVSYNPSYSAHRELLESVANKEMELIKKDQHLTRVTSKMFNKVPRAQAEVSFAIFLFACLQEYKCPKHFLVHLKFFDLCRSSNMLSYLGRVSTLLIIFVCVQNCTHLLSYFNICFILFYFKSFPG